MVCSGGIGLVQPGSAVVVKADNQSGDTERSATVTLGVALFEGCDVACDVLHSDRILHGQPVALASTLALLITIRASAVSPAKAMQTCSSSAQILRTVLSSCSFATDFFSTPRTTISFPRMPTAVEPFFTAS
uniref:Uncharacterized protein n=1 Tax=Anguilla anguilla TaxID=7936 RepID=A0A0E9WLM2_ANGAN